MKSIHLAYVAAVVLIAIGVVGKADQPVPAPDGPKYYIAGEVLRAGAYEFAGRSIDLLGAIDQARPQNAGSDYEIKFVHQVTAKLTKVTFYSSLSALREAPKEVPMLQSGDHVFLNPVRH